MAGKFIPPHGGYQSLLSFQRAEVVYDATVKFCADLLDRNANYETFRKAVENPDPEIRANAIIGLIKVTNYLLDQQLRRLEKDFVEQGGLRENMTRARLDHRGKQRGT